MAKKVPDPDENQPFDYFKKTEPAKKPDPPADNLVSSMRSDILMTSDVAPTEKSFLEKIDLKAVVGILITLFILTLGWFLLAGPGRPMLENGLAALMQREATPTMQAMPSLLPVTNTPVMPTKTPLPSPTLRPTGTPTPKQSVASPTPSEPMGMPTVVSACREALSITLADVGQTMCVKGVVIETIDRPNAFMVIFNTQPGSFYWASYDMVWSKGKIDTCYQVTGKIEQLANSPILIFNYNNIPEVCP